MKSLSLNWFTEDPLDAEYKQYILLAYLQYVADDFKLDKLYPDLGELIAHYKSLYAFHEQKNLLFQSFPERISEIDLKNFRVAYQKVASDNALMREIMKTVEFALPLLNDQIKEGKKIYDRFEGFISLSAVGIIPIYKDDGYLMLKCREAKEINVYHYRITFFEHNDDQYRGIHTQLIQVYEQTLTTHFESIKKDLLLKFKELPNPATFVAISECDLPIDETLLPISKRKLAMAINQS
jgi:hypothetical protein